uniref:ZP domain-containing protein n=1 Tax=Caenorhabditis tropicalis TaxID=1561998 RepID=A0A1I7TCA9_9PELO
MLFLKIFILILLHYGTVNGCLKLYVPKNPDLGNCKCSINLFNQNDVKSNEGGKYLGNQQIWDPIVSTTDDCSLSITCNAVVGVSSFFTVLFRSDGIPLFINRVVGNKSVAYNQPRSIDEMICAQDLNGTWQWFYYGSPIYDFSLGCVSDEDSCSCPKIQTNGGSDVVTANRVPDVPSQCEYLSASCPRGDEIPFMFPTDTWPIHSGSEFSSNYTIYEDLVCLKEDDGSFTWYFGDFRLPSLALYCNTNEVLYNGDIQNVCGTFRIMNTADDIMFYHRKGIYENAEFGVVTYEIQGNDVHYTCEDGYTAMVFSQNLDPFPICPLLSTVKCVLNPLNDYLHMWIAHGQRLLSPAGACVKIKEIPEIDMNGCACPSIKYIDQSGIIDMNPNWFNLATRVILEVPVFVSNTCQVSFDASQVENKDFHFMIFRQEAPPIFMRRFERTSPHPQSYPVTDLVCRKIGDTYQWDYGVSKITDQTLYVAFQMSDPCSCAEFTVDDSVTAKRLNETCDIMRFQCKNPSERVEISYKPLFGPPSNYENQQIIRGYTNDLTVVGAVCINSIWYINGVEVADPQASCSPICSCTPPEIFQNPSQENHKSFWERFSYYYPGSDAFMNRTANEKVTKYSKDGCIIEHNCDADDTFVVFSINLNPMVFPFGKTPDMRCVSPPSAGSLSTEKYWWIDNVMTTSPVFGCFQRISEIDDPEIDMNGCNCPQIMHIDQNGISELGTYSDYLSVKETVKPNITVTQKCEILIDESNLDLPNHQIMLFRKQAAPLFMRRYFPKSDSQPIILNDIKCAQKGGKYQWEYENQKISDDFIYITIQKDAPTCSCDPVIVDESVVLTELSNSCDQFQMTCVDSNQYTMVYGFYGNDTSTPLLIVIVPVSNSDDICLFQENHQNSTILTGTSCVDKKWYMNGLPSTTLTAVCTNYYGDTEFRDFDGDYLINKNHLFADRDATSGILVYDKDGCSMDYVCENDDILVVFSQENEPAIFESGEKSDIRCVPPPVAQGRPTEKYWWIKGKMNTILFIGCFPKIDESPIEMNGCQCPQLKNIDQHGISQFPESSYLNNRATFKPKVTVSESCQISVDASSMEINNFYLMLFRDPEPPTFMHNFFTSADKQTPFILTDITCQNVDNTYQWQYKNLKFTDKTLYIALQSNEESCGCEDFTVDESKVTMTKLEGKCDLIQFKCADGPSWIGPQIINNKGAENGGSVKALQGLSKELALTTAVCVNNQWQLSGLPLISPSATCGTIFDVYDLDYEDYLAACRCQQMKYHDSRPESETEFWDSFSNHYDKTGEFVNKQTSSGSPAYRGDTCKIDYYCQGNVVVVFSLNRDPMIYSASNVPFITCVSPPIGSQYITERAYWVDNVMLVMPMLACYPPDESPIEMNGCQCPQLKNIDQYGISQFPESSYLNNRATFKPKVTVSESCQISVDASSMEINNFYLMLFRDPEPPTFMHNFFTSADKQTPFILTDITCRNVDNKYQWQYKNLKFTDKTLYIALQSNEESCGCEDFTVDESKVTMTKLEGKCDLMQFQCTETTSWIGPQIINNRGVDNGGSINTLQGLSKELALTTAVCVNNQWQLSGLPLISPSVTCGRLNVYDLDYGDYLFACNCQEMKYHDSRPESETEFWDSFSNHYDKTGEFVNKQTSSGYPAYRGDTCKIDYYCQGNVVVDFSLNRDPMIYSASNVPFITCVSPPIGSQYITERVYWVDNVMLVMPMLACYP